MNEENKCSKSFSIRLELNVPKKKVTKNERKLKEMTEEKEKKIKSKVQSINRQFIDSIHLVLD